MTLFYKALIKYYHISGASLLDGVPEDLMEVIDPHWGQFPPQVKLFIASYYFHSFPRILKLALLAQKDRRTGPIKLVLILQYLFYYS